MRKFYLLIVITLCLFSRAESQVLISPTGDGGFESGSFSGNGWTAVADVNNNWYVGTAAKTSGTYGAYIDKNGTGGSVNTYNKNTEVVSHIYKDIFFPAGATNIQLNFKWRAVGESQLDFLRVYLVATTVTPVAGNLINGGRIGQARYHQSSATAFTTAPTITIANAVAGTTRRLVFTWVNDLSLGTDPPAAIDEVSLTYTVPPVPTIISFTPGAGCANSQSITVNGTGFTGATSVTIGGTAATVVSNTGTVLTIIPGNGTTGNIAVTTAGGTATSTGTFTVNPAPAVNSIGGGANSVCAGLTTPAFTNATAGGTWSVTVGTGTASITAGGILTGNTAGSVTVIYTVASGGCSTSVPRNVTVNPLPAAPVITPATATICAGAIQQLSVAGTTSTNLISETFESGGLGSFTLVVDPAHSSGTITQWVNQASPHVPPVGVWSESINSGSLFVLSNSDAGAVPQVTNNSLVSTTLNTSGYTALTLTFRHYYRYFNGPESGNVEVSVNGGSTWTVVQSYAANTGSAASFATASVNLDSYINQTNLKIRFHYTASWDWGWAIDDILLAAIGNNSITWSPPTNLYTNSAATTPYAGTALGTVYAKPSATSVYTATITSILGCTKSTNVTVTVNGNQWQGLNMNWFDPLNWCGGVPTAGTNVIIPASVTNYPVITAGTALANNISIAAGASVIVNGTGIFSLYGAITSAGAFDLTGGTLDLAGAGASIGGSQVLNTTIKNLTISNSGSSSILTGATNMLKVTGDVSFLTSNNTFTTNGNLSLVSGVTATASITDITNNTTLTGNSIVGNASVERYISAQRKWNFIAVNTQAGSGSKNTVQQNWMEGQAPGANGGTAGYGMWITDVAPAAGFDASSFTPTIKWWNGTDYTGITSPLSYDIRTKPAYMTYVRGDRSATGANAVSTSTVLRTYGALTQGSPTATTVAAGTVYTVLGNPYASAIDLTKVGYSASGAVNVAVWDPNLGGQYTLGAFQYLTSAGLGQDFLNIPGGGSYGNFGDVMNKIESGQGFFMQGTGTTRNVTFKEIAKTAKSHDVFFAPGNEQRLGAMLSVKESNGSTGLVDGFLVRMNNGWNTTADADDVRKMPNTSENISLKKGIELLAIEYRGEVDEFDTIKINMTGLRLKTYQWKFALLNMDAPGRVGLLTDRITNTQAPLNLNGDNLYDFTVTNAAASWAADRFYIVFRPGNVVPVKRVSVIAQAQKDGSNLIRFTAENEIGIDHYYVERSGNDLTFSTINTTAILPVNNAGGNAGYTFIDLTPLSEDNYYRVAAIGINGTKQYSPVVKVGPTDKTPSIAVEPNPVQGGEINLVMRNVNPGNYTLLLYDAGGKTILRETFAVANRESRLKVRIKDGFARGVYTLTVSGRGGFREAIAVTVL